MHVFIKYTQERVTWPEQKDYPMTNVIFYYGSKGREVDFNNPDTLKFNNGSLFFTSLKEAVQSYVWPSGYIYHCQIDMIPRARRLKEDGEPNEMKMLELMRASPNYQQVLKSGFSGSEKIAAKIMLSKSRTGAIVDLIRTTFYESHNIEFCSEMVNIGYDGYYGKFHPPASFHTDKEKFYYARLFDFDRIKVTKVEEISVDITGL